MDLQDPLAEGIVYEDNLPLGWRVIDEFPGTEQLEHINHSNESFLKSFASLDEYPILRHELDDDHSDYAQELVRLDLKINLLLELVGHVLSRQLELPKPVYLRMSSQGLEWFDARLPPAGSRVLLELYLHSRYPRPLELLGSIAVGPGMDKSPSAKIRFYGLSESVTESLEKLIFRHHRRKIASTRSQRV